MKSLSTIGLAALALGLSVATNFLMAQQGPDTIFYNGKIVTMNNHEVNGNVGTIAEAIAIRRRSGNRNRYPPVLRPRAEILDHFHK